MRKSSKFVSLLLAVLMAVSCFSGLTVFTASAETEDTKIYFDLSTVPEEWATTKGVYCHLYNVYGDETLFTPSWQTKDSVCKVDSATGLYCFDTAKLKSSKVNDKGVTVKGDNHGGLKEGCDYGIIFSTKDTAGVAHQTCNLTLSKECLGDTVYCTGGKVENTEDSSKMDDRAAWRNNSDKYGAKAGITSTGKIVGEFFPVYQPHEQIVSQAIASWAVKNADIYTPEVVQALCEGLEVEPTAVYEQYAKDYEKQLADPETYPLYAPLETVAELLGISTDPTEVTEPTTEATEPTTEATEPTTEATEPTTEATEPTTEATEPTTEATEPTTEATEPTTEATEPTTEATEPTTEEPTTAPSKWTVAGDEALTGYMWDAAQNEMTQGEYIYNEASYDYMIQFDDVAAGSYGCKVTNGTWDECYPEANVSITTNDTGYVKVYFNSTTKDIAVDAEYAFTWELEYITVVGNGDGNWLNGESWAVDAEDNRMTEVAPGVWEISFEDIDAFDNYQVKFACNGSWQPYNWTIDGVLDGQDNPSNEVAEDGSTVTLRIDVNGFDFKTGTGSVVTEFKVDAPDAPKAMYGDVNGDGAITVEDATLLQKISLGLVEATNEQLICADVTGDGNVSIRDVTLVQKFIAGGYTYTGLTGEPAPVAPVE